MNRPVVVFLAVLVAAVLLCSCSSAVKKAPIPPGRLHEPDNYSFDPPEGWEIKESIIGGRHKTVFANPKDTRHSPTIAPLPEVFPGPLGEYVERYTESQVNQKSQFESGRRILQRGGFTTDYGVGGIRLVWEFVRGSDAYPETQRRIREVIYFLGSDNHFYIVTCAADAEDGEKHDGDFDAALKSFRLH
jgi:hypothetical protein